MKCGSIYIIRNTVNSKVYVGKTTRKVNERAREHRSRLRNSNHRPMYQNMMKDGVKEISVEVVESNIPVELLREAEAFYIKVFDSINNGYNHHLGNRFDLPDREMADLYQYGFPLREIGELYGVDRSAVQLRVVEAGVEIRDWNRMQYVEELTEAVLIDLYVNKQRTTSEIADMFNTSDVTVSKRLQKYNIPLRPAVNRKYLK